MIPKKIHYCWFGGSDLPERDKRNIESWKRLCPDYEIIRWDESNYDITQNGYMQQAYEHRKWGFVPDYARLDIIYKHGGFYFDTDVELLKSLDSLVHHNGVMGFEDGYHVNCGHGFGAEAGNELIKELRDFYINKNFCDSSGECDLTPSPVYITDVLVRNGLRRDNSQQKIKSVTIYPKDYFCPKDVDTFEIKKTQNTISIHHFNSTWHTPKMQKQKKRTIMIRKIFGRSVGDKIIHSIVIVGGTKKKLLEMVKKYGIKTQ